MKNIFQSVKIIVLAVVLSLGLSYALAWTAPTATPPTGNVSAPINTSDTEQTKNGPLNVVNSVNSTYPNIGTFAFNGTSGVPHFSITDNSPGHVIVQQFRAKDGAGTSQYFNQALNVSSKTFTMSGPGADTVVANSIGTNSILFGDGTKQATASAPHGKFYGPGSWKAPDGVTAVFVTAVGGGGGGGGSTTWNGACSGYGGGGGGAGAFAFKRLVTVTPGTTYTVVSGTVGAGGPAGTTNALGGTGGSSGISGVFTVAGGAGGNGPWSSGSCPGIGGAGGAGDTANIFMGGTVAGPGGSPSNGSTTASGGSNGYTAPYGSGGKGTAPGTAAAGTAGDAGFVLVEW